MLNMENIDFGLGGGYSSDTDMITGGRCINLSNVTFTKKAISSVTYSDSRTGNKVASNFGFDVSFSGMVYPSVIGSLAVNFAQSTKSDRYSQTFNFIYNAEIADQVMNIENYGENNLNNLGKMVAENDVANFRKICGDKFIIQQTLGARLFASMQISFASNYDKQIFGMAMGVTMDWFVMSITLRAKLATMSKNENINLDLTISAYQEGGDSLSLAKIFNSTSGGVLQAINCGINHLEPCTEVIQGIVNYAKGDFTNQVGIKDGEIFGIPAVISNIYSNYKSIGIDPGHTAITPEIYGNRTKMISEYQINSQSQGFLSNLLYKSRFVSTTNNATLNNELGYKKFYFTKESLGIKNAKIADNFWTWTPEQIAIESRLTLIKSLSNINMNLDTLKSASGGLVSCFEEPVSCLKQPKLHRIDENIIKKFQTAYQLITTCGDVTFARFILPIDVNVFEENGKFVTPSNTTISFNNKYLIVPSINNGTKQISVNLIQEKIFHKLLSCGEISNNNEKDVMSIYQANFDEECAYNICPGGLNGTNLVAEVTFITVETPL